MSDGQYGGAPKVPIKTRANKKEKTILQDETLKKLQNDDAIQKLNALSKNLFARTISQLEKLAEPLIIDYHIVIFDESKKKRYSIIEGKKPTFGFKDLDFGIVGGLLSPYFKNNYSAVLAQFGAGAVVKPVVYLEKTEAKIETLNFEDISAIFSNYNSIKWKNKKEKNDFAIAATPLKDKNDKVIGAISIDFGAKSSEYPNFAFKESDARVIFNALYTMKSFFEIFIQESFSEMLHQAIRIVKEDHKADE